ncbi:heme-dependent catalase, partial [Polyplosphaeria fusca]
TDNGVQVNTTNSLRAGPRGYVLLEDTVNRKKIFHFDRERTPERVVHALGHGAYGTFESYGDWSNLTTACWLQEGARSEAFTRFSVVVASNGGSENSRDTHGFATKIYSQCGNHDLVGNHLPSFFINDGALFPDLIHSVKFEPDKGFPTGGSAHDTAYDFFTRRPEGAFQLMNVLSDLGIPRDVRHVSGNGVHTFRFINAQGVSQLFKWYWIPKLGHRTLVYDEATTIAGKNNNFQRVDLFNSINAGLFPEWDFAVQVFPDDGSYMFKDIDLLDPTNVVPEELAPMLRLGKLTLNRNPTNFFAEPEAISFAPSNVVKGVTFIPDPLLSWRLMSYDDTASHRHNSPNGYLLPVNRPIAPVDNNYRDGYMQPLIFEGASASSPNGIGGVVGASEDQEYQYTGRSAENVNGQIGRYSVISNSFPQARGFWNSLDQYAKQHTVDAYRFELGHCSPPVAQKYIDEILNNIDNCLARRVAFGIGVQMPAIGTASGANNATSYASLFPTGPGQERNKSNEGLIVGVLASDNVLSSADLSGIVAQLSTQKVLYDVIAPHMGELASGVQANQSFVTTSSVFYDAIIVGSMSQSNNSRGNFMNSTSSQFVSSQQQDFLREAYSHGKAIGAIGSGSNILNALGLDDD